MKPNILKIRTLSFSLLFLSIILPSCERPIDRFELEKQLQAVVDNQRLAGFGVAVFSKDSIYYMKGFGYSNFQNKTPYSVETPQTIASIAKTYIGFALAKCDELGLLSINDVVNDYLPINVYNPYFPEDMITIEHVASHTASFKYSEKMTDEINYVYADSSLLYFVQNYLVENGTWYKKENYHKFKPGDIWDYSNMGAVVAASIVEQVSGMSYSDFLNHYLFQPLRCSNTTRNSREAGRSLNYRIDSVQHFEEVAQNIMGIYPAGDFLSSVEDVAIFLQMIMNNGNYKSTSILGKEAVSKMTMERLSPSINKIDEEGYNQGLFWIHDKNVLGNPCKVIGHIGSNFGVFTSAWFAPKTGIGYVFLSNTEREEANLYDMIHVWKSLYKFGKGLPQ